MTPTDHRGRRRREEEGRRSVTEEQQRLKLSQEVEGREGGGREDEGGCRLEETEGRVEEEGDGWRECVEVYGRTGGTDGERKNVEGGTKGEKTKEQVERMGNEVKERRGGEEVMENQMRREDKIEEF